MSPLGAGGHRFDPQLGHTKDYNNDGNGFPSLAHRIRELLLGLTLCYSNMVNLTRKHRAITETHRIVELPLGLTLCYSNTINLTRKQHDITETHRIIELLLGLTLCYSNTVNLTRKHRAITEIKCLMRIQENLSGKGSTFPTYRCFVMFL